MGWRCFISDYDLLATLKELRREGYTCLPKSPPGADGTLTDDGILTCPSINFTSDWGEANASVPLGTSVNLVGEGFYFITSLVHGDPHSVQIAPDRNRQSVVESIQKGSGKLYVIGGYTDIIRLCYEEMYKATGVVFDENTKRYVYRAEYVPSTWRGADNALLYESLHRVLLTTMNWRDGVYDYWLNYTRDKASLLRETTQWQFDSDNNEQVDTVYTFSQTRLVR